MIEELQIAAKYGQKVTVKLNNNEVITGKAEISGDQFLVKIRTSEGPVWIPIEEIEHVERLVKLH
ncbi:hypothetical protein MUG84_00200 [Paenibacillus sp. KQZ6P-2]|uniref:Uncharacterized protein n=1 Tax=Paenibacillus mangrovi TaxID=2931978 RepID=A0A9X1WK11_9BACL|nr:hypothetical protein [Paenibacillus mangrovi]MCJ8010161.1 hypothetical protein [Paenibacillus mangrovi]